MKFPLTTFLIDETLLTDISKNSMRNNYCLEWEIFLRFFRKININTALKIDSEKKYINNQDITVEQKEREETVMKKRNIFSKL